MLICPICKQQLVKTDKCCNCQNGHSFDMAKQGYFNLLPINGKKSLDPGDNMNMVNSRHDFLSAGYYDNLANFISNYIASLNVNSLNILDCGCSEGYYLNKIVGNHNKIGLDISKCAIKKGASLYKDCNFIVASSFDMPIANNCMDIVLRIFAPLALTEYLRTLKQGGLFIEVVPGQEHLLQLKNQLYDNVKLNTVSQNDYQGFSKLMSKTIEKTIEVNNNNDIISLFQMTPYYYRTPKQAQEKLKNLNNLTVKTQFIINIYKKNYIKL